MEHHRLAGDGEVLLGNRIADARALPCGGDDGEDVRHEGVGLGPIILVRMIGRRVATLFVAGVLVACTEAPKPIEPVAQSGELVVLTVNGPVTYFEDAQGLPSGFEYDLVQLF